MNSFIVINISLFLCLIKKIIMKQIIKRGRFLTFMFMLLGCLSIQAANGDLITKQITIKLDKAGTLPGKIGSSKKNLITNLKIVGEVNGTDWRFFREMAGRDCYGDKTEGNLSVLDLSEVKIVAGGDTYSITSNDAIGKYAFSDCSGLTSLTLPAGITSIGSYAFLRCSGLTSLTLPAGITYIGESAFSGCSGLTSLTLSSSITKIGEDAFKECNGLKEVRFCINDNLDTYLTKGHPFIGVACGIKYYINDKEITSIEIPSNVTTLGQNVLQGCSGLTSVNLPAGITTIGSNAFRYCI